MTLAARLRRWLRPPRKLKFTREGRWFCGITLGVGIAAINTGNNLLYLVLGMMLSLILASGLLSEMVLRRLRVARTPPSRLHAGRPFLMGITLRNGKRRLPSFSIEVEDRAPAAAPLDKKCYFLKVPPGRQQEAAYRHTFARRGRYRLQGFRVSTRFPFGLFCKSREIDQPLEVIVFPAIYELRPPASGDRALVGDQNHPRRGRRGEFFGLREYRAGDDPRDVHWRKSARQRKPVVREYQEEAARRVLIQLDNGLPANAGADAEERFEQAISRAASLAAFYVGQGYALCLAVRGQASAWGSGPPHLTHLLHTLALLEAVPPQTPFEATPGGADIERVVA